MRGKITHIVLALLILTVGLSTLYSGTTGKIAGVITDADTGEPLFGVNVVIKGTSLGAASDSDGNYAILGVTPGIYTVMYTMIGYQPVQYDEIRVNIDLTTTINVDLKRTTLELGESIVVTAERKLVQRDMTSSLSSISADQIENLPVTSVTQVLRLNAGIIESAGRLHIRGGRAGEVAYWVDGVAATDVYDGKMATTVENSAVQEMQVISGTFNAEYGQAMSGIVNIITKEGGQEYNGQVKAYVGDYISSHSVYSIYKNLETEMDPATRLTKIVSSEKVNPLEDFNPIYNGEFSLSGPVPALGKSMTFFANARYVYNEGYFYGSEWYKPNGSPGNHEIVAMNPYQRLSGQGKLTWRLGNAIKLNYNVFWDKTDRDRNYFREGGGDYSYNTSAVANFSQFNTHDFKYVPNALPQYHAQGLTQTVNLNHILSPSTFYELRVSRYYSESKQYVWENTAKAVNKYLISITEDTTLGIIAETFDMGNQAKLDSIIKLGGKYTYVVDPNGPQGYIDPDDIAAPTSNSFMNRGMDITNTERSTAYWVAKLDFTSQINKLHQIKLGSELRLYKLALNGYRITGKTNASGIVIDPFEPAIPVESSVLRNDYVREPREFSAYLQDKVEYKDIIFNLGLRFDYFDANSVVPTFPGDPNVYAPFNNKNIYDGWTDPPSTWTGTMNEWIQQQLASGAIREYTVAERREFMNTKVKAKTAISPRLGIAFPITDRGVIHFSYGHFFQMPEFQYLYTNPDFKISSTFNKPNFGNADLEPQRTTMYEIGLQQQLSDNIGVDLTLFYRDVRDWVGTSEMIATDYPNVDYTKFVNKDYSNVRGVTVKIDKRLSDNYSFRADYTFQIAEGTYSNPTDAYNATLANREPMLSMVAMNWDQKHTLNAQGVYSVANWTFSMIGRYWSGQPYTPSFPVSETVGGSTVSSLTTNSARRPAQINVDLTINRAFKLTTGSRFEIYMNVYNIFDARNQTAVYGDTGSADYTTNTDPSKIEYNANRVSTVEDVVTQPSWYSAPRQVEAGIIINF